MAVAKRVMLAEASSLMLLDDSTNELVIRSAQGGASPDLLLKEIRIPAGAGIAGAVVKSGQPVNVQDVMKDPRFFGGVDQKSGFKTRAILAVPLVAQTKVIGVLEVLNPLSKPAFDDFDLESFQAFAAMATTAIERARLIARIRNQDRIDQELGVARQIQKSFLPLDPPCGHDLEIRAFYEPAREVSGDFYDFLECGSSECALIVADVSGKGVPAALQMARTTSQIRAVAPQCQSPSELLKLVNDFLCKFQIGGIFVTLICAILDPACRRIRISSAGHCAPLRRRNGVTEQLQMEAGIPLGISAGFEYPEAQFDLAPGDLFFFFTDGLVEARNARQEEYGVERLTEALRSAPGDVNGTIESVVANVSEFVRDAPQHDDLTLLATQFLLPEESLVFESHPRHLSLGRRFVERHARKAGFDDMTVSQIVLAVDEAIANVIRHSYEMRPDGRIELRADLTDHDLGILIRDYGKACDPNQIRPRPLEEIRPGGLGTHFIRSVMDEVDYTPQEQGMLLTMRKKRPQ